MSEQNKKTALPQLYQKAGLLFPTTPEEVAAFEEHNNSNNESPRSWDNPLEILKRKRADKSIAPIIDLSATDIQSLGMVAREEGKEISDDIRKKMNQDRNDAEKKQ